jgi:hypothetical protein
MQPLILPVALSSRDMVYKTIDWRKIEQGPEMDNEDDACEIHYKNQDGE